MRCIFIHSVTHHETLEASPAEVRARGARGWEIDVDGEREEYRLYSQSWQREPYAVFLPSHLNVMAAGKLLQDFMAANPGVLSGLAA